eukprot:5903806-Lingulodinium_polyedra.AAC.1
MLRILECTYLNYATDESEQFVSAAVQCHGASGHSLARSIVIADHFRAIACARALVWEAPLLARKAELKSPVKDAPEV